MIVPAPKLWFALLYELKGRTDVGNVVNGNVPDVNPVSSTAVIVDPPVDETSIFSTQSSSGAR